MKKNDIPPGHERKVKHRIAFHEMQGTKVFLALYYPIIRKTDLYLKINNLCQIEEVRGWKKQ